MPFQALVAVHGRAKGDEIEQVECGACLEGRIRSHELFASHDYDVLVGNETKNSASSAQKMSAIITHACRHPVAVLLPLRTQL